MKCIHQCLDFMCRNFATKLHYKMPRFIHKSLEEKTLCTVAFLDIQQAFDRVWHNGLLCKLKTALPTPYHLN